MRDIGICILYVVEVSFPQIDPTWFKCQTRDFVREIVWCIYLVRAFQRAWELKSKWATSFDDRQERIFIKWKLNWTVENGSKIPMATSTATALTYFYCKLFEMNCYCYAYLIWQFYTSFYQQNYGATIKLKWFSEIKIADFIANADIILYFERNEKNVNYKDVKLSFYFS